MNRGRPSTPYPRAAATAGASSYTSYRTQQTRPKSPPAIAPPPLPPPPTTPIDRPRRYGGDRSQPSTPPSPTTKGKQQQQTQPQPRQPQQQQQKQKQKSVGGVREKVGPYWWNYIHAWSTSAPVTHDADELSNRMRLVGYWIVNFPCGDCVHDASELVTTTHPLTEEILTNEGSSLAWYFFDLHNLVNKKLGKMQFTEQQFIDKFGE